MMRSNPFTEQPKVPQRVTNDGEPTVFAFPVGSQAEQTEVLVQEMKINDRNRGLFAIADGGASHMKDQGATASLAVVREFESQLGASLDKNLENIAQSPHPKLAREAVRQAIALSFMEAHNHLTLTNRANPGLNLRANGVVARMIDAGPGQKELFFTSTGQERIYLIRDEMVSCLGADGAAVVASGPLGGDIPLTVVHQEMLEPGDRLVMMGDDAARLLFKEDLQDVAHLLPDAVGPRAWETMLQEKAQARGEKQVGVGDLSVVVWEAFPMAKKRSERTNNAVEMDARRPRLQVRLREIAKDLARAQALSAPNASGRELIGAKDTAIQLEAEQTAVELELLSLDLPPRFKKGDVVSMVGQRQEIADVLSDGSYVTHAAGKPEENRQKWVRWDLESAVALESLPVRAGDRVRVEGFITKPEDGWRVTEGAQPPGKVLFEDHGGAMHMTLPDSKVKDALHQTFTGAKDTYRRLQYRRRQLEKLKKGA